MNSRFNLLLVFCLLSLSLFSQTPGSIDTSFQSGWFANAKINCIAMQPDGKLILAGDFVTFNNSTAIKMVRLNPDYTVDETFALVDVPNYNIYSLCIQPDGKIIIGGDFTYIGDYGFQHIARLNPDGGLDLTFNIGTGIGPLLDGEDYYSEVDKIVLQPDNKILISGYFIEFNGIERNGFARLNPDGTLDLTFNPPVIAFPSYTDFELLPDGKIFIAYPYKLLKLNSDGSTDATFPTVSLSYTLQDIVVLDDGKIMIAGSISSVGGYIKHEIARLYDDGTLDFSFFPDPIASNIIKMFIKPDGSVITIGGNTIECFTPAGVPDPSFSNGIANQIYDAVSDGEKIIFVGSFQTFNGKAFNRIAAMNYDGSLDNSLPQKLGGITDVGEVKTLEKIGEEIYVGGNFRNYNGRSQYNISRVLEYGGVDTTFITPTTGLFAATCTVHDIIAVESGKLLVGGAAPSFGGKLNKLNHNGSIDGSFSIGTGLANSDVIYSLNMQADGKYAVGGLITAYNGTTRGELIRIQSNGTYDANLSICCANYNVYTTAYQDDQRILLGGDFNTTSYDYFTRGSTAFANELEFIPAAYVGANGNVRKILYGSIDSSIYIFGDFTTVNTTARNRICKLNFDGSVDFSFNPGTGANNTIYSAVLLPDGRILIGGNFTSYNGISVNRLACILPDGTLDMSFNTGGAGPNNIVYDILLYDTYSVLIGGAFSSYNSSTCDKIARVFFSEPLCFDMSAVKNDLICLGGTYTLIDGTVVTGPGTYFASGPSVYFCDSTVTYVLATAPIYEYYVSAVIDDGEEFELADGTFATTSGVYTVTVNTINGCDSTIHTILSVIETCVPPTGMSVSMITSSSAKVSWVGVPAATKYQIWYRPIGAVSWQKKSVTANFKTLTGLSPSTTYEYKIKTICGAENSLFTPIATFTTLPMRVEEFDIIDMSVNPNPNNGHFELELFNSSGNEFIVQVYSLQADIVYSALHTSGTSQIDLDVANGIYLLTITCNNETQSYKLIIAK